MIETEEQIFIVSSVNDTTESDLSEAIKAISSYRSRNFFVRPVISNSYSFRIPSRNTVGSTLNSEIIAQIQKSIGAIIFIDDLRPNVAYEFGIFHGQRKSVLLITNKDEINTWNWISDIAGSSLLNMKKNSIEKGIHDYLNHIYDTFSYIPPFQAPEIPLIGTNMLKSLISNCDPKFTPEIYSKDFGEAITINTWGGFLFKTNYNILDDAKFKIVLRRIDVNSHYSIYFRIRFINANNERRRIVLGLSSNISKISFEANERNFPSEPITENWCLIINSFQNLLTLGQILGKNKVECIENIRFRAGEWSEDELEKRPPYEIGYFEIVGMNH